MDIKNKTILLADDDEIFCNGMRLILESMGCNVQEAHDGKEAIQLLSLKKYDLVISDYDMPKVDGLEVLRIVKESTNSSFILVCEPSLALGARQAKMLGAEGFLAKPFKREDFVKVVEDTFSKTHKAVEVSASEVEFVEVPMSEFITGSTLKVDLFLKMSEDKYLKIGNRGGTIAPDRVESYLSKGVSWLYMRKSDFALYVGFNINLAQKVHYVEKIECTRKIRLTMHVTENLISQFRKAGINRQQLEDTSNVVMNAVELINSSPDTMRLLESMEMGGTLSSHVIAVAIWSSLIAKQMGWTGQSTFFKIAVCAIFHDIGSKEVDDSLFAKPRFELSREQIRAVEGHTIRGRDILSSVPGMMDDVITVAVQHHELYRGGGYPYGLKFHQIHPLARLIGLADRMSELVKYGDKGLGIMAAFDQLCVQKRDFDNDYFKALTEVINSAAAKPSTDKEDKAA